jgi:hypothetical protein
MLPAAGCDNHQLFPKTGAAMVMANMGLPMVCVTIPTMLIALFPIAWVESFVYRASLDLPRKERFWGTFIANFWSTVVGIPIVWILLFVAQIFISGNRRWIIETPEQRIEATVLQAAWLTPYRGHLGWMVPTASLVLLLPFYLGSVFVEHRVLAERWRPFGQKPSFAAVMIANGISYTGLGAYYALQLWWQMSPGIT